MNRRDTEDQLRQVGNARATWNTAHREVVLKTDMIMRRLIHEAIANRMSVEQVSNLCGYTVRQVRSLMRIYDLDPKSGKQLLSRKAAEALANNAALLGIEPRDMDLMSPLAYLPAGSELRKQMAAESVSQVSGNPVIEALEAMKDSIETYCTLVSNHNKQCTCFVATKQISNTIAAMERAQA